MNLAFKVAAGVVLILVVVVVLVIAIGYALPKSHIAVSHKFAETAAPEEGKSSAN